MNNIHKIGRRKTAVARVYLTPGTGTIVINNREFKNYFTTGPLQNKVTQAFAVINANEQFDVKANVMGGGITGQAEAIRLAISRALCEMNPENRKKKKKEGLLTRNPKMVERKKSGQKKARKKFQFSKR